MARELKPVPVPSGELHCDFVDGVYLEILHIAGKPRQARFHYEGFHLFDGYWEAQAREMKLNIYGPNQELLFTHCDMNGLIEADVVYGPVLQMPSRPATSAADFFENYVAGRAA